MSEENVEVVRSILRAFAEGNRDKVLALVDPEVVIDATRQVLNPATYVGIEGARQMFAAMDEAWEEVRLDEQEFIDGGDRVVVMSRMIGKGKGSGVEVARPVNGQVWTIRDGRVTRLEFGFTDRNEALEAAGLRK
jgi:ketosteroid isomerase-like protein